MTIGRRHDDSDVTVVRDRAGLFGWVRDPRVQAGLDVLLVVLLVGGLWQQKQIRDTADDLKSEATVRAEASYQNCQSANDSRRALVGLLHAAERQIIRAHISGRQKADAVRFYERQASKVALGDCSVFQTREGGPQP